MSATKKVPVSSSLQDPTTDAPANTLNKVGTSPCEKHQCPHRERCASDELACLAFVHYTETGKTVPPKTLFVDAKPVMSDGRFVLRARTSTTRENYLLAFTELS
jgi:hypothetical protein